MGAKLTTKELFRRRALGSYCDADAVEWALGEVERHSPLPNLAALATLSPPLNHFEVEEYLRRALDEVGVNEPPHEETYVRFLREVASELLDGRVTARQGCSVLAKAHGGDIDRDELQPFWLLSFGMDDLEHQGVQFYYPGLTQDSFEELVLKEAKALFERAETSGGRSWLTIG